VDPVSEARMMQPGDTSRGATGKDVINCRCTMVPHVDEKVEKGEQEGSFFKNKSHQKLYQEKLDEYSKWEEKDFKDKFWKETGKEVKESLRSWQSSTTQYSAMALKYKATWMEKGMGKVRVPESWIWNQKEEIIKLTKKIKDEDYIKLRALTQAWYRKKGIKKVKLFRGVGGNPGSGYRDIILDMKKIYPNTYKNMAVTIHEDPLIGYTSEKIIASNFGKGVGGITIENEINIQNIFVSDDIWQKIYQIGEHESLIIGGDYNLKLSNISWY